LQLLSEHEARRRLAGGLFIRLPDENARCDGRERQHCCDQKQKSKIGSPAMSIKTSAAARI
jgi:hypothetical protein